MIKFFRFYLCFFTKFINTIDRDNKKKRQLKTGKLNFSYQLSLADLVLVAAEVFLGSITQY